MTEWQPIETAPKDGTPILAFVFPHATQPAICWWERAPIEAEMLDDVDEWQWQTMEAGTFFDEKDWLMHWRDSRYEPTHWQPLPDPPND